MTTKALHLQVLDEVDPERALSPFERNRAAARAIVGHMERQVAEMRRTHDPANDDEVRRLALLVNELAGERRRAASFDLVAPDHPQIAEIA
jgi:hypothetical protein